MKPANVFSGLGLFFFASTALLHAQKLAIDKVNFTQEPDSKVIVTYDLFGDLTKSYSVSLSLLTPDSDKPIHTAPENLVGDVGNEVHVGRNKKIVWDLLQEHPYGLHGDNFVFVVEADQGGKKWPWFAAGGAAAVGVGLYFLWDTIFPPPDLPAPPNELLPPAR